MASQDPVMVWGNFEIKTARKKGKLPYLILVQAYLTVCTNELEGETPTFGVLAENGYCFPSSISISDFSLEHFLLQPQW